MTPERLAEIQADHAHHPAPFYPYTFCVPCELLEVVEAAQTWARLERAGGMSGVRERWDARDALLTLVLGPVSVVSR